MKKDYKKGGYSLSSKTWRDGYSLIEIMVVLSLFAVLMLVATQTLLLSLRSTRKSESLGRVKENLEYTVSIMERQFRGAKSITACSNPDTIAFTNSDGNPATFTCASPGVDGYINFNNARMTDQSISILSCSITCDVVTGSPTAVNITIVAEDKSGLVGAERAQATSKTTVVLRQF